MAVYRELGTGCNHSTHRPNTRLHWLTENVSSEDGSRCALHMILTASITKNNEVIYANATVILKALGFKTVKSKLHTEEKAGSQNQ